MFWLPCTKDWSSFVVVSLVALLTQGIHGDEVGTLGEEGIYLV